MQIKNLSIKYTYVLCVIASTIIVYMISNNESFAEAIRPDDYSMGTLYYVILIAAGLAGNGIIVLLTQSAETRSRKFRIWVKANVITASTFIGAILLFALFFGISMSTGHWSFG